MSASAITFSRPTPIPEDPTMPPGDYNTWGPDEVARAEVLARLFAHQYTRDYSFKEAAIRLGIDPELAGRVGKNLYNHWLVRSYITQIEDRMVRDNIITKDRVAALLLRDASNFGPGSNAIARVSAQRTLAQAIGMDGGREAEKATKAAEQLKGGVVFIPLAGAEADWQARAIANQAKIRADADADDELGEEDTGLL